MNSHVDFRPKFKERASPDSAIPLFSALYIVLLAFFIMLVSMTQIDADKLQQVSESLQRTFSADSTTGTMQPQAETEMTVEQFFISVENSVKSILPLEEVEILTDDRSLMLTMHNSALFNRDDPSLRHDRRDFYNRLSAALNQWRGSERLFLSFIQGVAAPLSTGASATSTLEITRAGNFARFMENRGMAPENLSIAIEQGNAEQITLLFVISEHETNGADFNRRIPLDNSAGATDNSVSVPLGSLRNGGQP